MVSSRTLIDCRAWRELSAKIPSLLGLEERIIKIEHNRTISSDQETFLQNSLEEFAVQKPDATVSCPWMASISSVSV